MMHSCRLWCELTRSLDKPRSCLVSHRVVHSVRISACGLRWFHHCHCPCAVIYACQVLAWCTHIFIVSWISLLCSNGVKLIMRCWTAISHSSMVREFILPECSCGCHGTVISYLTFKGASTFAVITRTGSVALATCMMAVKSWIWNRRFLKNRLRRLIFDKPSSWWFLRSSLVLVRWNQLVVDSLVVVIAHTESICDRVVSGQRDPHCPILLFVRDHSLTRWSIVLLFNI